MAQRGIREFDGKRMLAAYWSEYFGRLPAYSGQMVLVGPETDLDALKHENPWLATAVPLPAGLATAVPLPAGLATAVPPPAGLATAVPLPAGLATAVPLPAGLATAVPPTAGLTQGKLVVKPDQLFGKRGKHGLIKVAATFDEARQWIAERMNKEVTVGKVTDKLTHFLIEPYVPHEGEFYVAIKSERDGDTIYFSNHGGVDIESVWDTVATINVGVAEDIDRLDIEAKLPADTPADKRKLFADFARGLFKFYADLAYAYLEINPFVVSDGSIVPLDLVARIDDTAQFELGGKWGDLPFPAPFGRRRSKEEEYIKQMDEKSGASLKLTVLNPKGRVWTMVAGGGASVIYTDTIVDLGYGQELANYGEYSGDPSTGETYEYAKTILDLMTREKDPQGRPKFLLIGGGIANFTDVAKTFTGIVMALKEYKQKLQDANARIFVRRGGPNYQEGLRMMKRLSKELGVPVEVYGPEMHMTRIVNLALKGAAASAAKGEAAGGDQ